MDEVIEKNGSNFARAGFIIVFFGMLTQISTHVALPSYNVPLGFWAVYSSFSKNGKATFGFIIFTTLSLILDIIYCAINVHHSDGFKFSLSMLIFCMFSKVYALFTSSHFFASIGGASSLDDNMNSSAYDALAGSSDGAAGGGYYPPGSGNLGQTPVKQNNVTLNRKSPATPFAGLSDSGAF